MNELPELIDGLPNICGSEAVIDAVVHEPRSAFLPESRIDFGRIAAPAPSPCTCTSR